MHYLIPNEGQMTEIVDLATRAKLPVVNVDTLRDFVLGTEESHGLLVIAPEVLAIVARHPQLTLRDVPTVVINVPGVIYPVSWSSLSSTFPVIDWMQFTTVVQKSGHVVFDPDDAVPHQDGDLLSILPEETHEPDDYLE